MPCALQNKNTESKLRKVGKFAPVICKVKKENKSLTFNRNAPCAIKNRKQTVNIKVSLVLCEAKMQKASCEHLTRTDLLIWKVRKYKKVLDIQRGGFLGVGVKKIKLHQTPKMGLCIAKREGIRTCNAM